MFSKSQKQDHQLFKISLQNSSYTIYYGSPKIWLSQVNKEEKEEKPPFVTPSSLWGVRSALVSKGDLWSDFPSFARV